MSGFKEFQCSCSKQFDDFDSWFNHMHLSGHIKLTDEEIQRLREFVEKRFE